MHNCKSQIRKFLCKYFLAYEDNSIIGARRIYWKENVFVGHKKKVGVGKLSIGGYFV